MSDPAAVKARKEHIIRLVLRRVDTDESRRREALADFMTITQMGSEASAARVAEMVPPIMTELYARWAGMFADRLQETLPAEQLDYLCDGSADNDAALSLAFLMFLESARMEEQMRQDLESYGKEHSGDEDLGGVAAACIRSRLAALADAAEGAAGKAKKKAN